MMVRAPFYDKNGVKKGAWSKEEDKCLSDYIQKHGHSNWRQLPKLAGLTRCGKSCRLRWLNYLNPNLKHGNYTREEEEMIIKLHHQLGNKWSLIAEKLSGRTDHEIKNYWHSYLKKCLKNYENIILDLKLKPCDILEENDETHDFVAPKSPISNVAKDFHYILESSTLSMPVAEISPVEDNYSPSSANSSIMEEDYVAPWLTFESFSGDFWTEPFVLEDTYTTNEISNEEIDLLIRDFYDGSYMF